MLWRELDFDTREQRGNSAAWSLFLWALWWMSQPLPRLLHFRSMLFSMADRRRTKADGVIA